MKFTATDTMRPIRLYPDYISSRAYHDCLATLNQARSMFHLMCGWEPATICAEGNARLNLEGHLRQQNCLQNNLLVQIGDRPVATVLLDSSAMNIPRREYRAANNVVVDALAASIASKTVWEVTRTPN